MMINQKTFDRILATSTDISTFRSNFLIAFAFDKARAGSGVNPEVYLSCPWLALSQCCVHRHIEADNILDEIPIVWVVLTVYCPSAKRNRSTVGRFSDPYRIG
ncbi:MAG: hypothetical protein QME52_10315 [Bacteroidota bacterium]|nr:hypothetical protein [Bacteroidota bacterium]